jgi:3-hydroxybutyryl-CoA dehydrogenase
MKIRNLTVAGSGVLGSQIAFQSAFTGLDVAVYDISDAAIAEGKKRFESWKKRYVDDHYGTQQEVDDAYNRLSFYTNLADAAAKADLVIEAIPEKVEIKQDFFKKLSKVAPEKTIFASNSSSFIPSQIVGSVDRPEKYLHIHFANEIWKRNVAEIMKHEGTADEVFETAIQFAKDIRMVPIPIHKKKAGYVLNTLLIPYMVAGLAMAEDGIADPKMIDKTWMITAGSQIGPFVFLDMIGPNTPHNIFDSMGKQGDKEAAKAANWIKTNFLEKGKFGVQSGEGVYTYPNPEFLDPEFLK